MLGEAAVWRPDKPTPTADQVLADPRYAMYLAGWPRQGDYGLVAEQDGPLGAAWYRTYTEASHGYGFVSEDVPELSIAVVASRRHEGIGRRLLVDLIKASVAQGYPALSLSVNDGIRRVASTSRSASSPSRSTDRPGQWSDTPLDQTEPTRNWRGTRRSLHEVARTLAGLTEDKAIPPALQRFMAERANATIVEVPASHVSFVSQPEAATQLILQAVEATAKTG